MKIQVDQITKAIQGQLLQGNETQCVYGVSIDSRTVKKRDVFFAIKGKRFDGHRFIEQVVKQGVDVIIVDRPMSLPSNISVIIVDDTTKALGLLAGYYRMLFDIPIIAITGTAGKTTTKNMLAKVLKKKYNVLVAQGSFNNHIGVPLTLFNLKPSHDMAIIETGTNQKGDIKYLAKMVRPFVAIFTNIGEGHLEKLKTPAGVFREKSQLAHYCQKEIVINNDDPFLRSFYPKGLNRCSYGINKKADYQASNIKLIKDCISFNIGRKNFLLRTPVYDYVYNALAVVACARLFKMTYKDIIESLKRVVFVDHRQKIERIKGVVIIDDSYNANPVSCRSAIQTLMSLPVKGRRWVVLGDMKELGVRQKILHRSLGRFMAEQQVDYIVSVGDLAKEAALTAQENGLKATVCRDVNKAKKFLLSSIERGDAILIKGSRSMGMDKIVAFLKDKFNER